MYPAIFVTTILCAMLHKWELSLPSHLLYSNPLNLKTVISSLMLLSSSTFVGSDTPVNGALWYINALVICYIFYYFFACLYYNYGGKIYDFLCLFMICGGGIIGDCVHFPFLYAERNGRAYFTFFLECLLYELFTMKLIEKYIKYTSVILIASLIVWWFNNGSIISLLNTEMFGEFDFAVTVLVITLVISIALCDNRVSGILSTRFFQALRHISSTLYMTHWVMITFLFIFVEKFSVLVNIPFMYMIFISLMCSVLFACIWNKTENYCRRLIGHFYMRNE